jgi:hypothetical protein
MASVREIVFPRIRGIYMVANVKHRWSREQKAWMCSYVIYVGESGDLALRLMNHRSGLEDSLRFGLDPVMVVLEETNTSTDAQAEGKKIHRCGC